MGKTYWMLVTDQRNFDITRQRGFNTLGVDSRNRRKAVRMAPDDRVMFYLSDRRAFAAVATVASGHFESHERIWEHPRGREDFPHRAKMRPDVVLDQDLWVDALQVGPTLEYVRKWAPEDWPLAFLGMVHIIPQRDFGYLEEEMRRAARKAGRPEVPDGLRSTAQQPIAVAAAPHAPSTEHAPEATSAQDEPTG
jgi:predicted RNA-binding protein